MKKMTWFAIEEKDSKRVNDILSLMNIPWKDVTPKSQADAPASAPAPKAEKAEVEKIAYTKNNGEVVYVTRKQAAAWDAYKNRRQPNSAIAEKVAESKAREPQRTRALEKALGIPSGSLKSTACTADEVRAFGWKGTRKELKAIKASIRG